MSRTATRRGSGTEIFRHQRGALVTRCFEKLKPRERALPWLAYVEGYAHDEIAGTRSERESIKGLLFRARRNLERILRENGVSEVQP
jgi:DNA-directed RNA polymerase specialized sigma24 family protein